jgi:hypothetical protein
MGHSSGRVVELCWLSNWVIGPHAVSILGVV